MTSADLRQKFLEFFEKKGHKIVPSSTLIPTDSSVLFTTSGMQQFKPFYLKGNSPYGQNVTSCQKCLRTSDIKDVGDKSHLTFFEMLGNFSFDGYFRKETVKLSFEFLFDICDLPKNRVWFTYFEGDSTAPEDEESKQVLLDIGIASDKIVAKSREDNFWGPTGEQGPCGPTIDIYYDLTGVPCSKGDNCSLDCDCGRFVELWSLVFNEYYQDKDKNIFPIEEKKGKKGVDTGLGLERLSAASQNKENIFETDLFKPLLKIVGPTNNHQEARILVDHIKASCFLISEGILPSNTDKGYILRRLLRRAIRAKKIIEGEKNLLKNLAQKTIEIYGNSYSELVSRQTDILTVIQKEEEIFGKTLNKGLIQFKKLVLSKKDDRNIFVLEF